MSKRKRLHSIGGKGKYSKFAGFVSSHYPPPKKICYTSAPKSQAPGNLPASDKCMRTDPGPLERPG